MSVFNNENVTEYVHCVEIDNLEEFKIRLNVNFNDQDLSVIHVNICNLKNIDHFNDSVNLLAVLDVKPDFIIITES